MTEKDIALALAKAHLDTLLTDYIVVGINRNIEPVVVEDFFHCESKERLKQIYELFLESVEDKLI